MTAHYTVFDLALFTIAGFMFGLNWRSIADDWKAIRKAMKEDEE